MRESWSTKRLADCCRIVSGSTPSTSVPSYWNGSIRWVTPRDLSKLEGTTVAETERRITENGLRSCAAEVLPPGTVLLSSRAPIGHVAITASPMATNQGFKSLIPDSSQVAAGYLYWWLRSNRAHLESLGNGATFKEISKSVVAEIKVPLPSLPEQQRIADILDQADALRVKRRAVVATVESITDSVFLDLFGDPVTNSKAWPTGLTLGDIASVVSGITKGRKPPTEPVREVPYLAVSNVQERTLDLTAVKRIEATEAEIARWRLVPGDLVLTEGGDPDKLGRGTIWRGEIAECIHQNHIFRVRVVDERVRPVFLAWLVGSARGKKYFLQAAKQTTGIASINMAQLKAFPMLLPPLHIQQSFERAAAKVEALYSESVRASDATERLCASLQHDAFLGVL